MSTQAAAYRKAAYPPPVHEPETRTTSDARRFVAHWNNSRAKVPGDAKHAWHEAEGVQFSNGRVAIDYGPCYAGMYELEDQLSRAGNYRIDWIENA